MFLPDPLVSLPNLISTLQEFHLISGLGVNLAKCSALPINIPPHISTSIKDSLGITLTDNSLQYLGVPIAPPFELGTTPTTLRPSLKLNNGYNFGLRFPSLCWDGSRPLKCPSSQNCCIFLELFSYMCLTKTWSREPITNSFGKANPPDMVNYSHIDPFHRED